MSQHASDVRTARVLFLAADLSKVRGIDIMLIVRSLMHILFAACPIASKKSKEKRRNYYELIYSL